MMTWQIFILLGIFLLCIPIIIFIIEFIKDLLVEGTAKEDILYLCLLLGWACLLIAYFTAP